MYFFLPSFHPTIRTQLPSSLKLPLKSIFCVPALNFDVKFKFKYRFTTKAIFFVLSVLLL